MQLQKANINLAAWGGSTVPLVPHLWERVTNIIHARPQRCRQRRPHRCVVWSLLFLLFLCCWHANYVEARAPQTVSANDGLARANASLARVVFESTEFPQAWKTTGGNYYTYLT